MLVDDAALTAQWVESELIPLATDAQRIATMSAASRALGEPEADERLADLVDEAFRGTR
jgi:UDP-N-acetylglucosamine--N-acetylmuramyl-(pentapeptide) pyrophosphoryl-undecaprenol N-acetylglucosamine transferase